MLCTIYYAKEIVENKFTPRPFVSFRVGFSLRKNLVRFKVYPVLRECGYSGFRKSRLTLMLQIQTFFRVLLQRTVKK